MNTTIHFMPNGDAERLAWLGNFSAKIPAYAASLGISPAEVLAVQKDLDAYTYIIYVQDMMKKMQHTFTAYKNQLKHARGQQQLQTFPTFPVLPPAPAAVPQGVFDRISKMAMRIKAGENYSDAIGHDLGIIAPQSNLNSQRMQPALKAKAGAGGVTVLWKKGKAQALKLWADYGEGRGWELINTVLRASFTDKRPLPEGKVLAEWNYRGIFIIGDRETGLMSSPVSIVVKRPL